MSVQGELIYDGAMVWTLFDDPLTDQASFTVALRFGSYDEGTAFVLGTPKNGIVPEPASALLLGIALAVLARRRTARIR